MKILTWFAALHSHCHIHIKLRFYALRIFLACEILTYPITTQTAVPCINLHMAAAADFSLIFLWKLQNRIGMLVCFCSVLLN